MRIKTQYFFFWPVWHLVPSKLLNRLNVFIRFFLTFFLSERTWSETDSGGGDRIFGKDSAGCAAFEGNLSCRADDNDGGGCGYSGCAFNVSTLILSHLPTPLFSLPTKLRQKPDAATLFSPFHSRPFSPLRSFGFDNERKQSETKTKTRTIFLGHYFVSSLRTHWGLSGC